MILHLTKQPKNLAIIEICLLLMKRNKRKTECNIEINEKS